MSAELILAEQLARQYSVDPFSPTPFSVGLEAFTPAPVRAIVETAPQVITGSKPMSLLKDLVSVAAPVIGGLVGGPAGVAIGAALGGLGSARTSAPGSGQVASLGSLPSIGGAVGGAVVGTTVRAGIAGARAILSSARYYCAKYPGWCISIGGLGAVQGMVQNGQLPVHRRRRARGITAGEFRGFRKVHKVLSGFCAPKMRIRKGRR